MIKLDDKILSFLLKAERNTLVTYLLINRYLTQKETIPLDHIQKLTGQTEGELRESIQLLKAEKILTFTKISQKLALNDCIHRNKGIIRLKISNGKKADATYIYNILRKNNNNLLNKNTFVATDQAGVEKQQTIITLKFSRALKKIKSIQIKKQSENLVNFFADKLHNLFEVDRTPEWRRNQMLCAKRLFKVHNLTFKEWTSAINYFLEQEYWQDKLTSLKQVEKNIHQYLSQVKKQKPSTNINEIS